MSYTKIYYCQTQRSGGGDRGVDMVEVEAEGFIENLSLFFSLFLA